MQADWQQFLQTQGAALAEDRVLHFGDAHAELTAATEQCVLVDLSHFGLIRFSGEETQAFLNGQLSSDVRKLETHLSQYSSYSTPKGRMLASFLLFREGNDYMVQLAAELLPAMIKRLSMYIMRTKTKASDASTERVRMGLAGPGAAAVIRQVFDCELANPHSVAQSGHATILHLPGQRYEVVVASEHAVATWQALAAHAKPAGSTVWTWTDICAGIPWIGAATQEEFVAQMANMELIGAVSFNKGCYPGQEIVARTQYLGKLKRRMYRAHIAAESVAAGQDVFSPEMQGQASGKIMLAAPSPKGGYEVLVVAQIASLEHGLHLGSLEGPLLTVGELPYAVH